MTEKVKQVMEKIESGNRTNIYDINFTLEEYLSKDTDGTTFLEFLLKKNIYIVEKKVFENSLEAAQIYLKLKKSMLNFNLDEENLFADVDGKRFIELLISENELWDNTIKNIKNNIEIIDILILNKKYLRLSSISPEIIEKLMTPSPNEKYPIEKYFSDDNAMEYLIPLINKPKELIELCKKYNKYDLLTNASIEVLMYKIDDNKTLLEDLNNKNKKIKKLEKIPENINFINFLREKKYYNYLKKAKESVLLLEIESGKTLLEELIEKKEIEKINSMVTQNKTIEILHEKNRLDLICDISNTILISASNKIINDKNETDETFLEYMLKQGYNPLSETYSVDNKKVIEIYCDKGYYQFLGNKILNEENLLLELKDGITIIDKLLDNNVDIKFGYSGFKSDVIAKKIFDKKRFDLLVKADLELLFNQADSEHSYLDYILESIKTKKLKYNLNDLIPHNYPYNYKAKLYLMIAKTDMMEYIEELSEEKLLKEYEGKTLLDELLELDTNLTINKILSNKVKSSMKIAIILKSKNLEQKDIDIPLENSKFDNEYLNSIKNSYGIGPLLIEGEMLLNKLYELFKSDGKSDIELVSSLVSGYRQALLENYNLNIQELRNLVEIKEKNPAKYIYIKDENKSYFLPVKGSVHCEKNIITTLLHETGHALHSYLAENHTPQEFEEVIERVRKEPETLKKIEEYTNEYTALKQKIRA